MKAQIKAQLSVAFCDVFFLSVNKSQEMLTSKPTDVGEFWDCQSDLLGTQS